VDSKASLTTFLKNTERALRTHTVEELNTALNTVLKDKNDRSKEIDFVLELVAQKYDISKRTLVQSNCRGKVQIAKKQCYCLLHFTCGMNTRFIAARIFNKWQNSVSAGIIYYKRLDPAIKDDKEFLDTFNELELKIKNANI
jgi:hypothetical protein